MKYARIESGVVREVVELPDGVTPQQVFHASQVWIAAPEGCAEGWIMRSGTLLPPDGLDVLYDRIDAAAGAARARYITVAPGQEATYMQKTMGATAYKAAGYAGDVPLMIQAEADAVGCTAQEAADQILAQAAAWMVKGSQIECVRRSWKLTVAASDDRLADCAEAEAELGAL